MKKFFGSILVIITITTLAVGASRAFFSDTETSTANTFQAGVLDLLVDNTSYYNGVLSPETSWSLDDLPGHLFFNFTDIKPSDRGEDTISLHINNNEAWSCMEISLTKNDDNTCTAPELADDPTCSDPNGDLFDGELAQNVNFVFWKDDGDNVLEEDEATASGILAEGSANEILDGTKITLADSSENNVGGAVGEGLDPNTTYYIGKAWCFGTLTLAPLSQDGVNNLVTPANTTGGISCDGTALNNATQSDLLTADVQFSAVQHRNNSNFLCNPVASPSSTPSATPTSTPTPSATPIACIESFASSAHENNQGTQKSGALVLANRSVPSAMFGAPQTSGAASDVGFPVGSFFSLGFKLTPTVPGEHGSIVLGFSSPFFPNPSGPDLQVYEVTGGVYPDEKIKVEVGPTSTGPWTLVAASAVRDASLELPGSVVSAQFVRLTDVSTIALFPNDADAYDVDALKATCTVAQ